MIHNSTHPDYNYYTDKWEKYRLIKEGGDAFIDEYLTQYSTREDPKMFAARREITPNPGFAAAAIIKIKNAIFQRMTDTTRLGGTELFREIMSGVQNGVDLKGSDMNFFVGNELIDELLFMGKVGVYTDMQEVPDGATLQQTKNLHPYYYVYKAEDIRNWRISVHGETTEFEMLLLRERFLTYDDFDLPSKDMVRYRLLTQTEDGVKVQFFNEEGTQIDRFGEIATEEISLGIKKIPFVLFELNQSLLTDIANHQIALLNLESSDISYVLLANFPHYIEQQSKMQSPHLLSVEDEGGTSTNMRESEVGGTVGRSYAQGLDAPSFIHPSAEPLNASMLKQAGLKDDINSLVHLALSDVQPKFASARSKEFDERGLESGLSFIGLVLENGEQQLAKIFAEYEKTDEVATISYPKRYALKSDMQRIEESEKLQEIMLTIPTRTGQKDISKLIVQKLFDAKMSQEDLEKLFKEIDEADYVTTDPATIYSDLEKGLVSTETASTARGYDAKKEVEQAKLDHAERIERIQSAQQARGVPDLDSEPNSGIVEKTVSQNADNQENAAKATRN